MAKVEKDRECRNLSLESFLIMPVQRVPRYVMLLADLLKNTFPEHPDHRDVQQALVKMKQVGDFINESKRDSENNAKQVEVANCMVGKVPGGIFGPSRRFIREGPIRILDKKNQELQSRYLHLFNDMLLISKPKKGDSHKFLFKFRVDFEELTVQEVQTMYFYVCTKDYYPLTSSRFFN